MLPGIVGDKPLDAADGNRLVNILVHFPDGAIELALALLRTYTSTNGRKQSALLDHFGRLGELAFGCLGDEGRDVDCNGTTGDAGLVLALQTAHRLDSHLIFRIPKSYFLHVGHPNLRILGGHFLQRNPGAFFRCQYLVCILGQQCFCLCIQLFSCSVHTAHASPSLMCKPIWQR